MSDTFAFDEQSAFQRIQEQARKIGEAQTSLTKAHEEQVTTVNESQDRLRTLMDALSGQANKASEEGLAASARFAEIQENPDFVNRLLGTFDPEFNEDALRARVGTANLQLQTISNRMKQQQQFHALDVERAATSVAQAQQVVTSKRQELESAGQLLRLGIAVEDEAREEDIEAAMDLDVQSLIAIRENIKAGNLDEVPAEFADKPGMIEAAIQDKQLKSLGVDAASIQNARASIAFEQEKTADALRNFTEEDLQQMARTDTFPAGITDSVAAEEVRRRNTQKISLASAANALEAGDIALANTKKAVALQASTIGELQQAFESASVSETRQADVSRGGVSATFSIEELSKALAIKQQEQKENINRIADVSVTIGVGENTAVTNQLQMGNMARELSPGSTISSGNAMESLPLEIVNILGKNSAAVQQLEQMKASLPPGPATVVIDEKLAKAQLELEAKIEETQQKIIDRTPDEQQGAKEEYLKNGSVTDIANAGGYLANVAGNPEALNHNPMFAAAWREVSNEFLEQSAVSSGSKIQMGPGGDFSVAQTDQDDLANIFERSLQNTGFRDKMSTILLQASLSKAILSLATQSRDKITGESPFDGIVDPTTGLLLPRYYEQDPQTGARSFNEVVLNVGLSAKNVELRRRGVLKEHETTQSFIYAEVDTLTRDLNYTDQNMRANSTEASLAAFAFNNKPGAFVRRKLAGLEANVDAAEKRSTELQETLNSELKAIEDATVGPPDSGVVMRKGIPTRITDIQDEIPTTIFDILNKQGG